MGLSTQVLREARIAVEDTTSSNQVLRGTRAHNYDGPFLHGTNSISNFNWTANKIQMLSITTQTHVTVKFYVTDPTNLLVNPDLGANADGWSLGFNSSSSSSSSSASSSASSESPIVTSSPYAGYLAVYDSTMHAVGNVSGAKFALSQPIYSKLVKGKAYMLWYDEMHTLDLFESDSSFNLQFSVGSDVSHLSCAGAVNFPVNDRQPGCWNTQNGTISTVPLVGAIDPDTNFVVYSDSTVAGNIWFKNFQLTDNTTTLKSFVLGAGKHWCWTAASGVVPPWGTGNVVRVEIYNSGAPTTGTVSYLIQGDWLNA